MVGLAMEAVQQALEEGDGRRRWGISKYQSHYNVLN
jgi:hypothetical protein